MNEVKMLVLLEFLPALYQVKTKGRHLPHPQISPSDYLSLRRIRLLLQLHQRSVSS